MNGNMLIGSNQSETHYLDDTYASSGNYGHGGYGPNCGSGSYDPHYQHGGPYYGDRCVQTVFFT